MTTAPTATPRTKTAYHILKKTPRTEQADTIYELVSQNVDAPNAEAAVKAYIQHAKQQTGTFVALPVRSWIERTVTVETTTNIRLS